MPAHGPLPGSEAALLRRTRLRLMAWSAGSTLVVLAVLGAAIYLATAASLAATSTAQLRDRLAELTAGVTQGGLGGSFTISGVALPASTIGVTSDPAAPGVLVGGSSSGTIAFVVATAGDPRGAGANGGPGGTALLPAAGPLELQTQRAATGSTGAAGASGAAGPVGAGPGPVVATAPAGAAGAGVVTFMPDPGLIEAALASGTVIRETTVEAAPVRVLAAAVPSGANRLVAIVFGDRSAELATLTTLLAVLLGGGLLVLAASVVLGYVYAGRALVPIRESLRRQREFAADASHELRTPLAINRAAIAELRRDRDDPEAVDRALDDLDAGAARLESLVDDLLLLARTDAGAVELELADTDLALAAAEASETLEPVAAARGIRLALDLAPAPVRGDEARLRQLARVLLDNAIRHSPDGGRVTVAVSGSADGQRGVRLVVEDEGPGIDPAHREAVFERFWRAPGAPAGGTGLGLAIARWIAERHGGSVRAGARADGPGARFVVELPAG